MKAIVCRQYGPPETLVFEEVPSPTPGLADVIVSMKAAGVNFPDTLIIQNKYQVKPPLPFSPGAECAGIVKEVGANVTGIRAGDRVIAFTTFGSFAEEVRTEASRVTPIPAGMDFVTAGAFIVTYGTADFALSDRGGVCVGETVLVLGAAGGIGIASIEIAKALGAHVIACGSSDQKLQLALAHGADETINYATADLRGAIDRVTEGRGVDVVLDPVGGPYTEAALRSLTWRGRLLVVGFAAGTIPHVALNLPLLKGCSIVGVSWTGFHRRETDRFAGRVRQLERWYQEGKLRPEIAEVLPLSRAPEALARMSARQVMGKIVIVS
jgi:NADPH2:quinone reductase